MSAETSELEPVATRKCGRCRQEFPTDPLSVPGVILDWWLCRALLRDAVGTSPLEVMSLGR